MSAPAELMAAFQFTEADLESNRSGVIHSAQQARLGAIARSIRGASARTPWIVGGFVIFGLGLMSIVYLSSSPQNFFAIVSDPSNLLALVMVGAVIVGIVAVAMRKSRLDSAGLTSAALQLLMTQGPADVKKVTYVSRGRIHSYWAVTVGSKTFKWLEDTATLFHQGSPYCIYYCQSGPYETVLSIDKLDA
jgi:hypothetical protein